jgi:hypothetical protein
MSRLRRSARRAACFAVAVAAAIGFVATGGPAPARADQQIDQISGNGDTPSALTVRWDQGLLKADNDPAQAIKRDPNSPYNFMYDDFKNLQVTVSQTQNLTYQSIRVRWSGGKQTIAPVNGNFLQIMQCYGDAATGPNPENCEYGSQGLANKLPNTNSQIGQRRGRYCATGASPNVGNPPGGTFSSRWGCDPAERDPAPSGITHRRPSCTLDCDDFYGVPFVSLTDSTHPAYESQQTQAYYDEFSTNEVQFAPTGADGTGEIYFRTLTAAESPALGCGAALPSGAPRGCWIVIVPRGEYEPNGHWIQDPTNSIANFQALQETPLGASTWAQRIQIHLGFDLLTPNCPPSVGKDRSTQGTGIVARAVFSWTLALNLVADCKVTYTFVPTHESVSTTQLAGGGTGLAFTNIPIGSEVLRTPEGAPGPLPPLVYAPVAASATLFAFNINQATGQVTTHVKLTPRLLAKALTQSYRFDLPDVDSRGGGPASAWAIHNPDFLTEDPEFRNLNPGISTPAAGSPLAPLLTPDHSVINQQVWDWIVSDASARRWLTGQADEYGMVVNPNYSNLTPSLVDGPWDWYPRTDPTVFKDPIDPRAFRRSGDVLPYVEDLEDSATHIRSANNPLGAAWDALKPAPDGQTGWWAGSGIEPAGRIFLWGVTGSADLASQGLVPADLCNADGTTCVAPDTGSVSAALGAAAPDATGLLHVDPAAPGAGAYPLINVTYAAVRTDQDAAALNDYAALVELAAGPGQTPGDGPGQLPRGFLPLPTSLLQQARAGAALLRNLAGARPLAAKGVAAAGGWYSVVVPEGSFDPTENVTGAVHSNPVPVGRADADGNGGLTLRFQMPTGLPSGPHQVVLTGSGSNKTYTIDFTLSGAVAAPTQPGTPTTRPITTTVTPTPPATGAAYTTTKAKAPPNPIATKETPLLGIARWGLVVVTVVGLSGTFGGPLAKWISALRGRRRRARSLIGSSSSRVDT